MKYLNNFLIRGNGNLNNTSLKAQSPGATLELQLRTAYIAYKNVSIHKKGRPIKFGSIAPKTISKVRGIAFVRMHLNVCQSLCNYLKKLSLSRPILLSSHKHSPNHSF